jgi:hypothetical protein
VLLCRSFVHELQQKQIFAHMIILAGLRGTVTALQDLESDITA